MEKTYECIGIFPLEFTDGQQVESGETFKRDFDKSKEGTEHEQWLISLGHIRLVGEVSKIPSRPVPVKAVAESKE